MNRGTQTSWLTLTIALGALALGCETGGVGDPCTPEDEYQQGFSGYSEEEVNVESKSFQCETRLCLVNHFRGRVSCPYGQTEADAKSATEGGTVPGNDPKRCKIPGTSGSDPNDEVNVAVSPQLLSRRADSTVYCSCRCDGPDSNAKYCECPSGFTCTKLLDDLGLGSEQLAGSYCIKDGTKFEPPVSQEACVLGAPEGTPGHCGCDGHNPPCASQ